MGLIFRYTNSIKVCRECVAGMCHSGFLITEWFYIIGNDGYKSISSCSAN